MGDDFINNLVEDNLNLIKYVIRKLHIYDYSIYDELLQVGSIGLINAAKNYDNTLSVSFATYAYKCIKNEILKFISHSNKEILINDCFNDEKDFEDKIVDNNTDIAKSLIDKEEKEILYNIINIKLSEEERKIIRMLYGINSNIYTQIEISDILDIPQYEISRMKKKILNKLRKYIIADYT